MRAEIENGKLEFQKGKYLFNETLYFGEFKDRYSPVLISNSITELSVKGKLLDWSSKSLFKESHINHYSNFCTEFEIGEGNVLIRYVCRRPRDEYKGKVILALSADDKDSILNLKRDLEVAMEEEYAFLNSRGHNFIKF